MDPFAYLRWQMKEKDIWARDLYEMKIMLPKLYSIEEYLRLEAKTVLKALSRFSR